jgi:hypothetical protein
MRSYIFTEKERGLIKSLLEGRRGIRDDALHVVVSRVRSFKALASDVDLYLELRRRLAESSSAAST